MSIFTKKQTNPAETAPEMWFPADIRDRAETLRNQLAESFDPLANEHATWRETADMNWLTARVEDYLSETKYDGFRVERVRGEHLVYTGLPFPTPTPATQAMRQWHREHSDEFKADAAAIRSEILTDSQRHWDAYITACVEQQARQQIAAEKQAELEERHRVQYLLCPVCRHDEPVSIGKVTTRRLIAGVPLAPTLRSCELCYAVAVADYLDALRAAPTSEGTPRADAVAAARRRNTSTVAEQIERAR